MEDFDFGLECPVPCEKCNCWVELNETRESELDKNMMLCRSCYEADSQAADYIKEVKDIQYMLDNNDPEVKGNRRGWKKNQKELKQKIAELGYCYDDYDF